MAASLERKGPRLSGEGEKKILVYIKDLIYRSEEPVSASQRRQSNIPQENS